MSACSAAHRPLPDVPRWAVRVAWGVQLVVLPSSVWRIVTFTFHAPLWPGEVDDGGLPGWFPLEAYVVLLSLVSELVALTAFGLVARWGEVWPGWVPLLRGRRVPTAVAVVTAALGSLALTVLWGWTSLMALLGREVTGATATDPVMTFETWRGGLVVLVYLPLVLWGPLLGALTGHYLRRRRSARLRERELDHQPPGAGVVAVGGAAAEQPGPLGDADEAAPAAAPPG